MFRNRPSLKSTPLAVAALVFVSSLVASAALAQRSVPVFVENGAKDPIPVSLVQSGGTSSGSIRYILCLDNINGPGVGNTFPGCTEASSLGLAVGRAAQESGEKGGTADINIGIGQLSTVVVGKPTDGTSARLFQYAINGNSFGGATIYVQEQREGWASMGTTMTVALDRAFVQSLDIQTEGHDEIVRFYFNKISLTTQGYDKTGKKTDSSQMCWDAVKKTTCSGF